MNHATSQIRRTCRDLAAFFEDLSSTERAIIQNYIQIDIAAIEQAGICSIMSFFDFDVSALDTPLPKDPPHVH